LAIRLQLPLITADQRLVRTFADAPIWVEWLGDRPTEWSSRSGSWSLASLARRTAGTWSEAARLAVTGEPVDEDRPLW